MKQLLIAGLVVVSGCVQHTATMNELSPGLTKADVLKIMGEPYSSSGKGSTEYLTYRLFPKPVLWDATHGGGGEPYYVKLVNGRVESYGRVGDFDSTKDPSINVNLQKR
jgi:hypothetical protein